jgi:SH3-like domain-containing protein
MRTLLTALTALMLLATPVVAGHCEHGYSANDIVVESVDFEQKTFIADPMNLRVGPGMKYCLKKTLSDGLSKSVEVIGQFQLWRQILLEGNSYWVHRSLLS